MAAELRRWGRDELAKIADDVDRGGARPLFLIAATPEVVSALLDLPLADGARIELVEALEVPNRAWSGLDVPVAEITLRVVEPESGRAFEVAKP